MTDKNEKMFKPLSEQEAAVAKPRKQDKEDGTIMMPVPNAVKIEPPPHSLGKPDRIWQYHNMQDELLSCVCRFLSADGKKSDLPMTYWQMKDGSRSWKWKSVPIPRSLYGLEKLAERSSAAVLVCEGEKATDAAQEIFPCYVTITSPNGAKAADKADWYPLLGKRVIIWPDNDNVGKKYAETVAKIVLEIGADAVSIVQVPESFPEKWDLADKMPKGITVDDLLRLTKEAQPVTLPPDPLEGLVERAENDAGEPFKPEVIEALLALKRKDLPKFESLWATLKEQTNVRLNKLEKEIIKKEKEASDSDDEDSHNDGPDPSQVDILLAISTEATLFCTADETAYADIIIDAHRETWPIKSRGFRRWLLKRYYEETKRAPNTESRTAALNAIEAQAYHNGIRHEVYLRTARIEDKIYIDLCDKDWRVIEVNSKRWHIVNEAPVRFRRSPGMATLPVPHKGGSIYDLRPFLNLHDEYDFILTVAFLLACLSGKGPYPVLAIFGEHGSAKSTFAKILKMTVDPNTASLRTFPREERDLYITAINGYVLVFDNVSHLPGWISDAFCRLSTGGGFATRQLHTDQDEVLFDAVRPLILNGIEDVITRADLADRAIIITLEPIPDDKRKTEKEVLAAFERKLPVILGALLEAIVHGLKALPNTQLESLPRMADFALWATACEKALWESGKFMEAYNQNRADTVDEVLEADSVALAIKDIMDMETLWEGTATQLLDECNQTVSDNTKRSKHWPQSARALSNRVKRAASFLRRTGFDIQWARRNDSKRTRIIRITSTTINAGDSSSEPSGSTDKPAGDSKTAPPPSSILTVEEVGFDMRSFPDDTDEPDANSRTLGVKPL